MRTARGLLYVIREYERGIIETFGKYAGYKNPGLHLQIPFAQLSRIRDTRELSMAVLKCKKIADEKCS